MQVILSQTELETLGREWQKRLGLEFWNIAYRIVRMSDFDCKKQGECSWTFSTAKAVIRLLDPIDYDNKYFSYDMEQVLVHELIHLHMAGFDQTKSGSIEDDMMERATEMIANALVELKRASK